MSAQEWTLRAARPQDIPKLPAIERAAEKLFPPERLLAPSAIIAEARLSQSLTEGCLWIAEADDEPIAFCAAQLLNEDLHIQELDVLPEWQRRGIGSALVTRALMEARNKQCGRVTLTTFADFAWNAPFYKKLGFVQITPSAKEVRLTAQLAKEKAMGYTLRVAMAFEL